jgi:hypothetical protein
MFNNCIHSYLLPLSGMAKRSRAACVYLVVSQFYLFIAADILKTMVSYDERVILNIDHVLIFCSCADCAP